MVGLLVVPIQMALIPIFSLYSDLGIFDTVLGLVLFHTAFGLPFAIFLLRNFFTGIPRDLLEAARIDGASELRIFVAPDPAVGPAAIASLAIFQFLWVWNDLLVALTFGRETQPITVAIFSQLRQFSANIELIAPAPLSRWRSRWSSSSRSSATSSRACWPAPSSKNDRPRPLVDSDPGHGGGQSRDTG